METTLFAVAIKADCSTRDLENKTEGLCKMSSFEVPSQHLRVGTLDTLMSLSDDLIKMDALSDATVWKIYRQLTELKEGTPTVMGVDVATYAFKQFEWDEAKFQLKTPLRELCESIGGRIGGLDEELKTKMAEYNSIKGALQQNERKAQGNLMVRGLTDIVTEADMRGTIDSESMVTVLLVVSRHSYKEFLSTYETACEMVVPRSAKLIAEDSEMGLYGVVVFKKTLPDFYAACREKRWAVRDFKYEPNKVQEDRAKKEVDMAEESRLKKLLTNWCQINFAEAYTMMMHLKAVRVFVESVLRYGLTHARSGGGPNFKAFLLHPKKNKEGNLHKVLSSLYGGSAVSIEHEDDGMVPGATGEFYPYVFVSIDTEAPNMA